MAKKEVDQVEVIGWYQPHRAVNWTGEIVDPKTGELVKEKSMTKQEFKEECDINTIVKRIEAGQTVDHMALHRGAGVFEDLPDAFDFQESMNIVAKANEAFAVLPADVRARFNNEPARFLAFTQDEANAAELITLGLATERVAPPPPPPVKVEVINPTPPQEGNKK